MKLTLTTEPLGLPRGTVRGVLTLTLVVALVVVTVLGYDASELAVLTGIAVRDYFAHRQDQNQQDGPPLEPPALN